MQSPEQAGHQLLTTNRKALVINLDETRYGTFAEIGAGQEVARHFFHAGGAAGTIAKTMSAYDMAFSDAIYGRCKRYVSQDRLLTMLGHEYELLHQRLAGARGARTRFFVFANTVAARSYRGDNECHGWLGVRFQAGTGGATNDILVHVRMWDRENLLQQQAIGILGVNLIYGAFYLRDDPPAFIRSLADNLTTERIEIDLVRFSGPDLAHANERLLALQLVDQGMTNAVLFGPDGACLQPSTAFYKKALLVQRGRFHPVTRVNLDMMRCAADRFAAESGVAAENALQLFEMRMARDGSAVDHRDFLARVATLSALGAHVLVSSDTPYFRLTGYFRRYTHEMIAFTMGARALLALFNESAYEGLDGGILEAFGRMFKTSVRLYVYPRVRAPGGPASDLVDANNFTVSGPLQHLYDYMRASGFIQPLAEFDPALLGIYARDARRSLRTGDQAWESMVPEAAARVIREQNITWPEAD